METHDPLCEAHLYESNDTYFCICKFIAQVRADEREHHTVNNPMLLADLRTKVETLVEYGCPEWSMDPDDEHDPLGVHVRKDQVLALLGGSDG